MPKLLETFDQLIRSSEIRSSDPLSRKWRGGCSIKFHNIKSLLKLTCSKIIWLFDQKFYQLQITFDNSLHITQEFAIGKIWSI